MREKAAEKLGNVAQISDGDFLTFPVPEGEIDTVVSTYAFHHLTDEEKRKLSQFMPVFSAKVVK